jgi:hypothetical protein
LVLVQEYQVPVPVVVLQDQTQPVSLKRQLVVAAVFLLMVMPEQEMAVQVAVVQVLQILLEDQARPVKEIQEEPVFMQHPIMALAEVVELAHLEEMDLRQLEAMVA